MWDFAAAVRARASARLPRCALVATVLAVTCPLHASADGLEYKLKAEFLERFTRFIEWPAGSFASADAPFALCVVGPNPFGGYLEQMAATRKIQNRKISIRSLSAASEIEGCHLVFIARGGPLQQVIAKTADKPVLTVGDTPGYSQAGVLINFFLDKEFVRFEINSEAVKKSGLKCSSKLLDLGKRAPAAGG